MPVEQITSNTSSFDLSLVVAIAALVLIRPIADSFFSYKWIFQDEREAT